MATGAKVYKAREKCKGNKKAAAEEEILFVTKSALEHFLKVGNAHKFCQGTITIIIGESC